MASIAPSDCENPVYPNWMWRYNRNKHLTWFEPRYTRVEQWPPHYRNMGVNNHFQFHPNKATDGDDTMWRGGLSYAKDLVEGRETGFGNGALGLVPGPAPPRFIRTEVVPHKIGELLKMNCIENITEGASLHDHNLVPTQSAGKDIEPLDPRQYLMKTLGQPLEYPGTFPYINGPAPKTDIGSVVCCGGARSGGCEDPLSYWIEYNRKREEADPIQRSVLTRPYPEYCCEYGWESEIIQCKEALRH